MAGTLPWLHVQKYVQGLPPSLWPLDKATHHGHEQGLVCSTKDSNSEKNKMGAHMYGAALF